MQNILMLAQIILSVLVIFLILIQPKGKGLGSNFAGSSSGSFTRRGLERWVFKATFVVSFLFIATSIIDFVVK